MSEILQVTDLKKVYGKGGSLTRALDGVSLSLEAGEFVGVMGPSGSGKTTLLNCVSTIDRPAAGSIVIDGREIGRLKGKALAKFRRERLGFIFQDCNLLDTGRWQSSWGSLTVWTNTPIRCPGASSSGAPPPGLWSPVRPSCWPTSPPAPWTPSPPSSCWTGWRR